LLKEEDIIPLSKGEIEIDNQNGKFTGFYVIK
jgi:hypothetical protein